MFGKNFEKENLPNVIITEGLINEICRARYGSHESISVCCGSLLLGGRHLSIFVMYIWDLFMPTESRSSLSKLPALPAKGLPVLSSLKPGASPINITCAS